MNNYYTKPVESSRVLVYTSKYSERQTLFVKQNCPTSSYMTGRSVYEELNSDHIRTGKVSILSDKALAPLKEKPTMKKTLFLNAWSISKRTGMNFSEALKYAWKSLKMKMQMLSGSVEFSYKKVNGDVRHAIGTLKDVPATKSTKAPSGVLIYFEEAVNGWRSTRIENLT